MYKMNETYKNAAGVRQRALPHSLPLSEFRANAAAAIALVEQGATVRLLRHGKPVADLVPIHADGGVAGAVPNADNDFTPAMGHLNGGKTIQALLADRNSEPW